MKKETVIEKHLKELSDQLTVICAPANEENQVVTLLGY